MKTHHFAWILLVFGFTVSAVSAQLVRIDYEGWYDYIDERTGKPDPGSIPVPFEAQAILNLRSAVDVVRQGGYTEFTPRDWDREGAKNVIRWRAFEEEFVFSTNTVRVWDSGRFDVAYYDRMAHLNLTLFLRAPLDPDRIPGPPFEFAADDAELGQVTGRYVLRGSFFVGSFTNVTAELVPVPEPASYGLAAAALLAFLTIRQRRKRLSTRED